MTPTPETLKAEAAEIRLNERSVVQPNRYMLALADRLDAAADAWLADLAILEIVGAERDKLRERLAASEQARRTAETKHEPYCAAKLGEGDECVCAP